MDYSKLIAKTVQSVPPSGIRKYFDYLDETTISLGVGEPDFPTPEAIRREALERLSKGRIPYSSNAGIPELRELVLKYIDSRFSMRGYDIKDILITVGASQAIDLALRSVVDPGDEVIVPEPTYVSYVPGVVFSGGIPVSVVTTDKNRFKLTAESLKNAITPKTKALILPFPNNPTGGIMEKDDLEKIREVLIGTDIIVIADEIYAELTYNNKRHVSISTLPGMKERTVVLNGFSKAFSMTGWRVGFAVGPTEIIAAMTKVHQLTMLCAPMTGQQAGIAAIRQGLLNDWADVRAMVDEYAVRRRYLVDAFNDLGLFCNEPEGAFYAFPSIKSTGLGSEEFCDRLLHHSKVVTVPGTAFGKSGEGHIRCCYATSMDDLKEAIRRICEFLKTLKN
jgi:aminotransferase